MQLKVIKPFRHNGQDLRIGEVIDETGYQASKLLQQGVAIIHRNFERAVFVPKHMAVSYEPQHMGGGWYKLADGRKVRKSELEREDNADTDNYSTDS